MKLLRWIRFAALGIATTCVASAGAASAGTKIDFSSLDTRHPYKVSGTLYLPESASSPVPAIVLVHGTLGIDQRGELYRQPLLDAGIGIFEVDFKTGIYRGTMDRPEPDTFLPMAFAALKVLRKLPTVDPARIGIMGFSLGGNIALRTTMETNVKQWMGDEKGFAVFALFYPVCNHFTKDFEKSGSKLTGGPIVIFYGTEDSYGEGKAVPELKRLLAAKYNFQLIAVEYSGGSVGTYALFGTDGELECSGNVFYFGGSLPAKSFPEGLRNFTPDPASQLAAMRGSCKAPVKP